DFTFTKDGQNTYFVTVVSTRSEYADSAAVFQASNAADPNKEKTGLVATELAAATAAPTVVFVDKATASAKTDMNVKVTTAAAKQTVYVEIFKNVAGTPKVAEYSEYIATSGQSKTFDFSDKITEKGSYFAKAYAKAVGAKDSSIVTTKSKDF
ncbi:MAG: hypothetical protein RSB75_04260, partial [Anaerovoracaceae bacterium]